MKKIHLVFRDNIMSRKSERFVPFLFEYEKPANYLKDNYGAKIHDQKAFFENVCENLTENDCVIIFINCEEKYHEKLLKCKAKKVLRAVDPSKSDMILYKNGLALHEKVEFDSFAICYPNKQHIEFLEEKNIEVIVWPHSLDFKESKGEVIKKGVWISAGQQHEEYYPSRWNLTEILLKNFNGQGTFLPHPGYDTENLIHPYVGEKFLELLEDYIFIPIGVGINDGLHMKFVEAAYSNMLPIGTVPSYLPEKIKSLIPFSNVDPKKYTEESVVKELSLLINDKQELTNRIIAYKEFFKQNYDLPIVLERVAKELIK